ncbi:hypothetical protein LXL04_013142 [Taraxacum kok-saghyz]
MACITTPLEQQQSSQKMIRLKSLGLRASQENPTMECDDELSKSALFAFRAKEEEITKKKMEVKEKVQAQLSRVEQETKKLAEIRNDLEALDDPSWKEGAQVRKKVDLVNKELKSLGQNCLKKSMLCEIAFLLRNAFFLRNEITIMPFRRAPSAKSSFLCEMDGYLRNEKEYKEAIDAFNEKNKEKAQLVSRLMELISESEIVRMKKLEEINKKLSPLPKHN